MIDLQILNLVLNKKDISIINQNNFTADYFPNYQKEFTFITDHYNKYGIVPDKATFVDHFPEFTFINVEDSSKYLVEGLKEEYLYNKTLPVLQQASKLLTGENADSRKAVEYLSSQLPMLSVNTGIEAVDLIHEGADQRYADYEERVNNPRQYFFSTGFPELDEVIGGFDRKEEYAVICARPGVGKSFVLDLFALHHVRLGLRVGLYSGEMTDTKVGYRIDTLFSNISNFSIVKGRPEIKEDYKSSIEKLKQLTGNLFAITPKMLGGFANIPALRSFCEKYKLDILYIDQISLLNDISHNSTQSRSDKFSNISRAIKDLQTQLQIPIIVASQLNRELEKGEDPSTMNIAGSDTISQDMTIALSLQKKDENIVMQIMKNRDGSTGNKLTYHWNVDKGLFTFIPTENDATNGKHIQEIEEKYNKTGVEVF